MTTAEIIRIITNSTTVNPCDKNKSPVIIHRAERKPYEHFYNISIQTWMGGDKTILLETVLPCGNKQNTTI